MTLKQKRQLRKHGTAVALLAVAALVFFAPKLHVIDALDKKGNEYYENAMLRMTTTYISLAAANAVVSVIKDSHIDLPVVTIAAGQVLDPVDDIVETASSFLFTMIAAFGSAKILIEVIGSGAFMAIAVVSVLTVLCMYLLPKTGAAFFLGKTVLFLVLLRFMLPVNGIVSQTVHDAFTNKRLAAARQTIDSIFNSADKNLMWENLTDADSVDDTRNWLQKQWDGIKKTGKAVTAGWSNFIASVKTIMAKRDQLIMAVREIIVLHIFSFLFDIILLPLAWYFFIFKGLKNKGLSLKNQLANAVSTRSSDIS